MKRAVSAESVRDRLVALAKERGTQAELLMTRYAVERLLFRLGESAYRDRFVLKGALLFDLWFDQFHRPTRDADLLGSGDDDPAAMAAVFADVAAMPVDDGVRFDVSTVKVTEIREQAHYPGLRVTLVAYLSAARLRVQVDIGFGDVLLGEAHETEYPGLLSDLPPPRLRVYPKESVIAEKLHILTTLGIANSRLKDYYDLWVLAKQGVFEFTAVAHAVSATFRRRGTELSTHLPVGLEPDFADNAAKQAQWQGFLRKTGLVAPSLPEVVDLLRDFLGPLVLAATDRQAPQSWQDGGPWKARMTQAAEPER